MVNPQVADENLVPNPPIQVMTSSPEAVCLTSKESLHLNKPSALPDALYAPQCVYKSWADVSVGLVCPSFCLFVCLSVSLSFARFITYNKQ